MSSNPVPRVLCVDDDEDSREILSTLLRFSRIETKAVGTAAQALSLIQAERFDLYLLDARLPDLDGFELCRRMRAFDPHTPILFYSGAACDADKKRGIEAGADAYVIKPDVDGLLATVKQFVSHAASATAVPIFSQQCPTQQCLPSG
jgi:two-component system OmpR family response regulator